MSETIQRLRVDHQRMRNVLGALQAQVAAIRQADATLDERADRIFCCLDYLAEYSQAEHHPHEDEVFDAMCGKNLSASQRQIVEHNRKQHEDLANATRDLLASLQADTSVLDVDAVLRQIDAYVDLQQRHMRYEEETVFPIAQDAFNAQDWTALDARFGRTNDPLFDHVDRSYAALYPYLVADAEQSTRARSAAPLLKYLGATGAAWKAP